MKNCTACGQPTDDAKFCSQCGEAQVCLDCGTEFTNDAKFCANCGTKRSNPSNQQQNNQGQTTPQPNATAIKQPFNFKNVPWFVWVIGAAVVIFLAFNLFSKPSTPEEVVEGFINAIEKRDTEEVKKFIDPTAHDLIDFSDFPSDIKMEIVKFDDVEIEDDIAYVDAVIKVSSKELDESETDNMDFELEKQKDGWVITDAY